MTVEGPDESATGDDVERDTKSGGPNVCAECCGTGRVGAEVCGACGGTGRLEEAPA
jgi:DnaJ-class molecular chaperone